MAVLRARKAICLSVALPVSLALLETSRQRKASCEDDFMAPTPSPSLSYQASKDGGRSYFFWAWGVVPERGHNFSRVLYLNFETTVSHIQKLSRGSSAISQNYPQPPVV